MVEIFGKKRKYHNYVVNIEKKSIGGEKLAVARAIVNPKIKERKEEKNN